MSSTIKGPVFPLPPGGRTVFAVYTNWRGETADRYIVPLAFWFGSTEWHPDPQWFMTGFEPVSGKQRDFALAGFKHLAGWERAAGGEEA